MSAEDFSSGPLGNPRVMITGSSGFIGSRLVNKFKSTRKIPVIGIDVRKAPTTDILLDLSDKSCIESLKTIMRAHQTTHVIHLAALINVEEGESKPLEYWNSNVKGTYNVLTAMDTLTPKPKMIFTSSAAVYDLVAPYATVTPTSCRGPKSVYGWSKYRAEDLIKFWGIDYFIVRLFNVAGGKEENPQHLIPKTFEKLSEGESPVIYGTDYQTSDGTCMREYVHVKDVVFALFRATSPWSDRNLQNKVCNLSNGQSYSVKTVCNRICRLWTNKTGQTHVILTGKRRCGDVERIQSSMACTFDLLKWVPQQNLQEMIKDTYKEMFPAEN